MASYNGRVKQNLQQNYVSFFLSFLKLSRASALRRQRLSAEIGSGLGSPLAAGQELLRRAIQPARLAVHQHRLVHRPCLAPRRLPPTLPSVACRQAASAAAAIRLPFGEPLLKRVAKCCMLSTSSSAAL